MADPLDKSPHLLLLRPPQRTRGQEAMDRLDSRLRAIKRMQVRFTAWVLVGTALWWVTLFLYTRNTQATNFMFTNTFQYLAVAWCCWFMYPYFMRVEAKQDVALAMGHDSVDLMAKMDDAIEQRGERFDKLMTRMERIMEETEQGKGALATRFETMFRREMRLLRQEIRDERGRVDNEIGEALEEGEAAADLSPPADATEGEPCAFCAQVHDGPCLTPTGGVRCAACGTADHDTLDCPTGPRPVG